MAEAVLEPGSKPGRKAGKHSKVISQGQMFLSPKGLRLEAVRPVSPPTGRTENDVSDTQRAAAGRWWECKVSSSGQHVKVIEAELHMMLRLSRRAKRLIMKEPLTSRGPGVTEHLGRFWYVTGRTWAAAYHVMPIRRPDTPPLGLEKALGVVERERNHSKRVRIWIATVNATKERFLCGHRDEAMYWLVRKLEEAGR